jgi:FkbM family methyltransferase
MQVIKRALKKLAARLPRRWQQALKRVYFAGQIRRHLFRAPEPEFDRLSSMVSSGDWVLDIGANVGHYALRLSALVGESGRVIAFEPVPESFEVLVANAAAASAGNITLINAAASESPGISGMVIPKYEDSGLDNFYLAQLSGKESGLQVLCIAVDSLDLPHPIRLAKIDTEGHELAVLKGMSRLLRRDHPQLIVEDNDPEVPVYLAGFGYSSEKIAGSSNRIFRAADRSIDPGSRTAQA